MVTTFIIDADWNDRRTAGITARTGVACISCWTALRDALDVLSIRRFALGKPPPRSILDAAPTYFERLGSQITADGTLNILAMAEVPRVRSEQLPTFADIQALEHETGLPVLSSNQVLLWRRTGSAATWPPYLTSAASAGSIEDVIDGAEASTITNQPGKASPCATPSPF